MQKKRRLVLRGGLVQLPKNANKCKSVRALYWYHDMQRHLPQLTCKKLNPN